MLGKIVPFVLVGYVQMTVVLVLGEADLRASRPSGSFALLYLLTVAVHRREPRRSAC